MANRAVPREDLTDEENLHHMQIRLHDLEDIVARVEDRAAGSMALAEELARAKAELISQRRRAEDNARKINSILDAVIDGIISVNADGVVESANASAYRMLNSNARKLIGAHLSQFLRGLDNRDCTPCSTTSPGGDMNALVGRRLSCTAKATDGASFPAELVISRTSFSGTDSFTCVMRDVTEQRKAEQEIQKLALYDQLTRLSNRYEFEARLKTAITLADRQDASVALLLLDLDNFKHVNDNYGHPVGDELLQYTAQVLLESVRESDTVARIGGDEFAIILINVEDPLRIRQVAERIVNKLSQPVLLDGSLVHTGTSVGISIYPRDATDSKELVRLGDKALYEAKTQGRGTFQYYDEVMDARARGERILENDLRLAVVREEFEMFFQPQLRSVDGGILGAEALIRWRHPDGELKMPGQFIVHAEKTGIINDIGKYVLLAACREARRWRDTGMAPMPVAVNVSPSQVKDDGFVAAVTDALEEAGIGPEWLEIELTENIALDTGAGVLEKLNQLDRLGVRLAIDDFGTGYASLAYLRKLPVRKLKIDQTLIANMLQPGPDYAITEAIVNLGRSLNFTSIAEGVETTAQADAVRRTLCSGMQGFLFSRPLAADDFRDWLAGQK